MSKLNIKVVLPQEYDVLHVIKRVNYPFNQTCRLFMLSVIRLAKREQLDVFGAFGRIGHALAKDTPMDWVTDPANKDNRVRIEYKEEHEEIIDFYRQYTDLTNKQITTMFMRLMVRLCHTHGPHLMDLVYLIDTLPAPAEQVEITQTEQVGHPRPSYASQSYAPQPRATQPRKTQVDEGAAPTPQVKKRKVKSEKKPVVNEPQEPAQNESQEPVVNEPQETVEKKQENTPQTQEDDFLARAERLKESAQDALNQDVVVSQNPLFKDFAGDL